MSLAQIRARTYKPLDAWWTVLLVDPVASRLLVCRRSWMTPDRLAVAAFVAGLGAAAGFARGWLPAGALVFYLATVVARAAAGLARMTRAGSLFGAWFAFMADRVRAVLCAFALFGGLYLRTGQPRYLWLAAAVIALSLLRYLDAGQMARVRAHLGPQPRRASRFRTALHRRRIRVHLVSGVEFESLIFVVAPLTGTVVPAAIVPLTGVAGLLLVAFEAHLMVRLRRATRPVTSARQTAAVRAGGREPALAARPATYDDVLA